ncbi:MAG: hypothetical protein CMI96_04050 [Pelagibacteraceae bacterium]|nr:hypothetical protein [Pelagibacteraceae bacterium]|tara:strand:+ start:35191 stop:35916 length:726 start_codon:yes stop_codon:yes gene_type:complete
MNKKSILVVGASGSIGSAVAIKLIEQGYKVGLHYCSNRKKVENIKKKYAKSNKVKIFQSHLATQKDCKDLVNSFKKIYKDFYGLAICAGTVNWKNYHKLNKNDFDKTFFEIAFMPYFLCYYASKILIKPSRMVYLSSISIKYRGSKESIHYASAKSALESLMRSLAKYNNKQILINGVRSGFVISNQQKINKNLNEMKKRINKIPIKRAGKPEEVAAVFEFLFNDKSSFIHDSIITVSGGD